MNKMTVIELLNKIANGEELPEKFRFAGQIFEKQGSYIEDEDGDSIFESIFTDFSNINDEVEIIEEDKKIRKIKIDYSPDIEEEIFYEDGDKPRHCILGDEGTKLLINKINEIIDYLNNKENK